MTTLSQSGERHGGDFVDVDLRGARFVRADLSGVVMRAVDVAGADIDAPWLLDGESSVAGEWTFSQTLRHLVMATDTWLGRAILEIEPPRDWSWA